MKMHEDFDLLAFMLGLPAGLAVALTVWYFVWKKGKRNDDMTSAIRGFRSKQSRYPGQLQCSLLLLHGPLSSLLKDRDFPSFFSLHYI